MKTIHFLTLPFCLALLHAQEQGEAINQDSLIFKDGGNVFGEFHGFDDKGHIKWKRKASTVTQSYDPKELSQFTINGQRPKLHSKHIGQLILTNGNSLPGAIQSLTKEHLVLATDYSGELTIPRVFIKSFHPTPYGSQIILNGINPSQKWKAHPYRSNPNQKLNLTQKNNKQWQQHGASLYGRSDGFCYTLNKDINLPDNFVCRFKLARKGNSNLTFIFHADMATPAEVDEKDQAEAEAEDGKNVLQPNKRTGAAVTFGNCLSLRITNSNYYTLTANGVDENNQVFKRNCTSDSNGGYSAPTYNEEQLFEIFASRETGTVSLYIDGKKKRQWFVNSFDYPKTGDQLAFIIEPQGPKGSARISNLIISNWNTIIEPVAGFEHKDKDIAILTNGTDRFAGTLSSSNQNVFHFDTGYTKLSLQSDKLKSIFFAKKQLKEAKEKDNMFHIRFFDNGHVTGEAETVPGSDFIKVKTGFGITLKVPIKHISSVQFDETFTLLDTWNKKH